MKILACRSIVRGHARGYALATMQPINLLTIDADGIINDSTHELNGRSISNRVLVFPNAIGSSVGAYRLYAAKINGRAPSAVVCSRADIITASACAISNIPMVTCRDYDRLVEICRGADGSAVILVDAVNGMVEIE